VGEIRNQYKVLVRKSEGKKRPLGRHGHRLEDTIKIDLKEIGLEVWTELIWLRTETGGRLL
jgi:hypothetical protein